LRTRGSDERRARGAGRPIWRLSLRRGPAQRSRPTFAVLKPVARGPEHRCPGPMSGDARARTVRHRVPRGDSGLLTLDSNQRATSLAPQSAMTAFMSSGYGYNTGLGDCTAGGGCGCGGRCGLGLFDTGWDISGWTWMEWGVVLLGAYFVISAFSTTARIGRRAKRGAKRIAGSGKRRRKAQAEELRRKARELEGDSGRRRSGGFLD